MPSDEYFASKSALKLKGVDDSSKKKKKKKKKKDLERQMEANIRREAQSDTQKEPATSRSYTDAEKRFLERKRKMEAERILKKASLTHKEKVEEFNRHLDSLTEHFDIPKVSWTK